MTWAVEWKVKVASDLRREIIRKPRSWDRESRSWRDLEPTMCGGGVGVVCMWGRCGSPRRSAWRRRVGVAAAVCQRGYGIFKVTLEVVWQEVWDQLALGLSPCYRGCQ